MIRSFPAGTFALATLALLAWASPALSSHLVYDRTLVEQGQLWRLATSALVHWSTRHLLLDLTVVVAAGAALERIIGWRLLGIAALSALIGGIAVHLAPARLDRFAGLSGVAFTLVALVAVEGLRAGGLRRAACLATLAALLAKVAVEACLATAPLADDMPGIVTATSSHAAGLAVALALALHRANFRPGRLQ